MKSSALVINGKVHRDISILPSLERGCSSLAHFTKDYLHVNVPVAEAPNLIYCDKQMLP